MKRFMAKLEWHNRKVRMPKMNRRILVYSPEYDIKEPFGIQILDSQFYKTLKNAIWWAYIDPPNIKEA